MINKFLIESLILLAVLELFFAYLQYRIQPDIFYIVARLLKPQYLIPAVVLPVAYFLMRLITYFLFA